MIASDYEREYIASTIKKYFEKNKQNYNVVIFGCTQIGRAHV